MRYRHAALAAFATFALMGGCATPSESPSSQAAAPAAAAPASEPAPSAPRAPRRTNEERNPAMEPAQLAALTSVMPADMIARTEAAGGFAEFVFGNERTFPQCHASTIAQTSDGTLVVAWFGGTAEKDNDVGIWLSRRVNGTWTAQVELAKVNETPHWNPVLFNPPGAPLTLYFKIGPEIPTWQTYVMTSNDAGATWSAPRELAPGDKGGRGPVKNKPILLSDGAWLAGASTEFDAWIPFADRSEDGGLTWERSADWVINPQLMPGKGAIQPTLWESKPGMVHALLRTTMGRVCRADSPDGGRTWSPVYITDLPNNNSGLDVTAVADGRLFLLYNPSGENWGSRSPLTLAMSADNGKTWSNVAHLETTPGEYSYPAIITTDTGVALCYTWKRERVRAWHIPLTAL